MAEKLTKYSDAELYAWVRGGGAEAERAFGELYDRLAPRVYKYCRRVLRNEGLAEDIFQECFVNFYRSAAEERTMTNVAGYILKIARNLCLNAKSSKYYGLAPLEDMQLGTRDTAYEDKELLELIRSAVECLPDDFREAFVLREYDGLSYQEIADVLELSIATVKIRIYRARQKLRKLLSPYLADL